MIVASKERQRKTKAAPRSTINSTTMDALGMIYVKGNILFDRTRKNCQLKFEIRYKKPTVSSERSDNKSKNKNDQTNKLINMNKKKSLQVNIPKSY